MVLRFRSRRGGRRTDQRGPHRLPINDAGERLQTAVVEEVQRLRGPVLLVLRDFGLRCAGRHASGGGRLSELLRAMDIAPDARTVTPASVNDSAILDRAAVRTGRFDATVYVGCPNPTRAAARKLIALLPALLSDRDVDATTVTALPVQTGRGDLREIVRRTVLCNGNGRTSIAIPRAEVGSGRDRSTTSGMNL